MNFNVIKQIAGNGKFLLQKHSPELLIFGGIAGMVGSTVIACKATKKLDETVTTNKVDIEKTKEEFKDKEAYKREVTFAYLRAGGRLVKLYSPAVLMGGASISAVLCGHSILHKRNLAMAAAYSALDEGWTRYRKRVVDELGEEADRKFRHGAVVEDVEIEEVDDNGKKKKKKVKAENIKDDEISIYAKFFDQGSVKWTKNADDNLFILRNLERYANEMLQARGHLFLNEVYDMLDIPRTRAGSVVGWKLGNGDDYVSFGLYDRSDKESIRRFVNGYEAVILLDFNVDEGFIYDKI